MVSTALLLNHNPPFHLGVNGAELFHQHQHLIGSLARLASKAVRSVLPAPGMTKKYLGDGITAKGGKKLTMPIGRSFTPAKAIPIIAAGIFIFPATVNAHAIGANAGGFLGGLEHPVFGPDHLLAMFAVGLWGAQIGGRSVWELPVAFPLIMALGGTLGIIGIPLPYTETLIAASMIVLGLAVAFAWRPPPWQSIAVVGAFAIFHGHAHGVELPSSANPFAYALGFVVATGLIHIAGIGFGLVLGKALDGKVSRAAGAAISLAGAYYLLT